MPTLDSMFNRSPSKDETWEEIEVANSTAKIGFVDGNPVLILGPDPYPQTEEGHDNTLVVRLGQIEAVPADSVSDTATPTDETSPE